MSRTSSACDGFFIRNTWQNLRFCSFLATKPNMQLGGSAEHMETYILSARSWIHTWQALEVGCAMAMRWLLRSMTLMPSMHRISVAAFP